MRRASAGLRGALRVCRHGRNGILVGPNCLRRRALRSSACGRNIEICAQQMQLRRPSVRPAAQGRLHQANRRVGLAALHQRDYRLRHGEAATLQRRGNLRADSDRGRVRGTLFAVTAGLRTVDQIGALRRGEVRDGVPPPFRHCVHKRALLCGRGKTARKGPFLAHRT